ERHDEPGTLGRFARVEDGHDPLGRPEGALEALLALGARRSRTRAAEELQGHLALRPAGAEDGARPSAADLREELVRPYAHGSSLSAPRRSGHGRSVPSAALRPV